MDLGRLFTGSKSAPLAPGSLCTITFLFLNWKVLISGWGSVAFSGSFIRAFSVFCVKLTLRGRYRYRTAWYNFSGSATILGFVYTCLFSLPWPFSLVYCWFVVSSSRFRLGPKFWAIALYYSGSTSIWSILRFFDGIFFWPTLRKSGVYIRLPRLIWLLYEVLIFLKPSGSEMAWCLSRMDWRMNCTHGSSISSDSTRYYTVLGILEAYGSTKLSLNHYSKFTSWISRIASVFSVVSCESGSMLL